MNRLIVHIYTDFVPLDVIFVGIRAATKHPLVPHIVMNI